MVTMKKIDVLIIGAGAAGLMCGIEAGARNRKVLILDKSNKAGKKILALVNFKWVSMRRSLC